jgi:hypothetical protein
MRKDVGGLVESLLDSLENGNGSHVARQLALLHPFAAQQAYARARVRDNEQLMITLTPLLWAQAGRTNELEHDATRILRSLMSAIQAKDKLRTDVALTAAFEHMQEVSLIPSDGEYIETPKEEGKFNEM